MSESCKDNSRRRNFRSRRNERTGVESAHLQPEPGQQPLSAGRARFRSRRKNESPNLRKRMEAIPEGDRSRRKRICKIRRKFTPKLRSNRSQGAVSLVREGLNPLLDRAPKMKKELAPLCRRRRRRLSKNTRNGCEPILLPRSDGDFRLGMDKFRKKLRFALASDLSVEEI